MSKPKPMPEVEEPSLVPPGEAAIVTSDNMNGGLRLLLPRSLMENDDKKTQVPSMVIYLTACAMRSEDEEFVKEQIAWFESRPRS